jgi:DMSO/TMAO reductase YedYZ molybdopterin-dependent catalytic subunit
VKWLRALELLVADVPGTWERKGYHLLGDPWREQRYDAD